MSGSDVTGPAANRAVARWLPSFLVVWAPQVASLLGSGIVQFALVWWLTSATGSAVLVGVAAAMTILPRALFNPVIGVLVDRFDRKAIMIGANLLVVVCSISLAVAFLLGGVRPWQVLTVLLLHSTADTCYARAFVASTSRLAPSAHLTRIAGINQALIGVMMMASPGLGALLLESSSFVVVMAIDLSAAVLAIIPLMACSIPSLQPDASSAHVPVDLRAGSGGRYRDGAAGRGALAQDIRIALRYLRSWPGAIGMLIISAAMNFVMQPYFSLLAVYVAERGGDESMFGVFGTTVGFGFLAGGALVGVLKPGKRRMVTALFGIAAAGVALIATSVARGRVPALCCFLSAAAAMPFCMGPVQALIQDSVPSGLQGRVFSIIECVSTAVAPLGLLLAGFVFEHIGSAGWYVGGGVAALVISVAGALNRRVRDLGPVALQLQPSASEPQACNRD